MFRAVVESESALRVMTDGISIMLTPEGMADSRISQIFQGAITTFLPKPDKEEEKLEMVQNQRPITIRTALFKISTVIMKNRFMGALEAAGTVDAEQLVVGRRDALFMRCNRFGTRGGQSSFRYDTLINHIQLKQNIR